MKHEWTLWFCRTFVVHRPVGGKTGDLLVPYYKIPGMNPQMCGLKALDHVRLSLIFYPGDPDRRRAPGPVCL